MISKYPGLCRYCKKPTLAEKDHYDLESKTGYHSQCQEDAENAPASKEQYELAERLGYKTEREWNVLLLPPEANGDPTFWDRSGASGRDEVRDVPSSDEISVNDVRGEQEY